MQGLVFVTRELLPETMERLRSAPDGSPTRCPYCHEGIDVDGEAWLVCEGCLARHHAACWEEGGCCSACGGAAPMIRPGDVRSESETAKRWAAQLEDLAVGTGALSAHGHISLRATEVGLPSPPRQPMKDAMVGSSSIVAVERTLDVVAPAARLGAWRCPLLGVSISHEGTRTRVRLQANLSQLVGGYFGGLVGGIGGGAGGGLSSGAHLLAGPIGIGVWVALCLVGSFLLARFLFARHRRLTACRLEKLLELIEGELKGVVQEKGPPKAGLS